MARTRLILWFLAAHLAAICTSGSAFAERRVALVIGNADYLVGPLTNPVRDADAIALALRGLGFQKVIRVVNATKASMEKALAELADEAGRADIAVVYFAGHGTERDGRNYLIPIDARLARASDLELQAISLTTVLDQLTGASKLKLVILDACRNNLFPLAGSKRTTMRGLARIEPDDNALVVYAAKDGTTADDGTGRANSPFTTALLKHIATPGIEVDYMFRLVRDDVMAATNRQQQPHIYGTLGREKLYLASVTPIVPVKPAEQAAPSPARPVEPVATVPPAPLSAPPLSPPSDQGKKPRDVFRDCPTCPEMVVVPAGRFRMGSPSSEPERKTHEGPQRWVTIARPFAVGKFEVTFEEWEACVAEKGCSHRPTREAGQDRRPVTFVSWNHITNEYLPWLNRKLGLSGFASYRLLTEAEWEYAARAGTTTAYAFGAKITRRDAHYYNWEGGVSRWRTTDVGSFRPNAWGLHDMHGNAMESVQDCYVDNYANAPTDGSASPETHGCSRVARDSGLLAENIRSAGRTVIDSLDINGPWFGFRVARSLNR